MAILSVGAVQPPPSNPSAGATRSFGAVLRSHDPTARSPPSPGAPIGVAALEDLERVRERLDAALDAARHGQVFTAQELLALQAQAYRYTQTFEVASKVVEHGAQSLRQAVNLQV